MLVDVDYNNINETKDVLKSYMISSKPIDRKKLLQSITSDNEFKKFYTFIVKNKISNVFRGYNLKNLISYNTDGNYLNYLYIILMSNPYEVDFDSFYNYYGLNREEKEYISKIFYIDLDYKEKEPPSQFIKNILYGYYTMDDVKSYMRFKFKNITLCRLYRTLNNAFKYIKQYPNLFNINDKNLDDNIEKIFNKNQLTKTSLEPVIGLDVNRYKGSTITSPTRTTDLPLTKTVVEPVIETPSCVSPVDGCVCLSHLSPTRTTDLPLTKTSLDPEMDFLGGYGEWLEQTSPTRTTALDI